MRHTQRCCCAAVGEIFTPLYAGSLLGGGIGIFLVAVMGLCAACDRDGKVRWLWLFMLLTLLIWGLTIIACIFMFSYEKVLLDVAGASEADAR